MERLKMETKYLYFQRTLANSIKELSEKITYVSSMRQLKMLIITTKITNMYLSMVNTVKYNYVQTNGMNKQCKKLHNSETRGGFQFELRTHQINHEYHLKIGLATK